MKEEKEFKDINAKSLYLLRKELKELRDLYIEIYGNNPDKILEIYAITNKANFIESLLNDELAKIINTTKHSIKRLELTKRAMQENAIIPEVE